MLEGPIRGCIARVLIHFSALNLRKEAIYNKTSQIKKEKESKRGKNGKK